MNIEKYLKEFDEKASKISEEWFENYGDGNGTYDLWVDFIKNWLQKTLQQQEKDIKEELIKEEIAYWKDVFDNRPQERDLKSDTIAQNFARIELEKWENKLKI
jgi:hypothetical protein